ncbi:hypothetical protein BGZ60DRAFT_431413 [Tricladium varicosporioides]|nr:hypothetical protein BGZ60DRAFT_431413 [Hymenoscyphus varicosporioides]
MAALATMTMGDLTEGNKKVFPLFHKQPKAQDVGAEPGETQSYSKASRPELATNININGSQTIKGPQSDPAANGSSPTTPRQSDGKYEQAELLEVDPNDGRRKRRKTNSPNRDEYHVEMEENDTHEKKPQVRQEWPAKVKGTVRTESSMALGPTTTSQAKSRIIIKVPARGKSIQGTGNQLQEAETMQASGIALNETSVISTHSADNSLTASTKASPTNVETVANDQANGKPKKVLKFNPKTGTIGSPPSKKTVSSKASSAKNPKSKVVVISYGNDKGFPQEFGLKVQQILDSRKSSFEIKESKAHSKPSKSTSAKPSKEVHPLFLGRSAMKAAASKDAPLAALVVSDSKNQRGPLEAKRTRPQSLDRPNEPANPTAPMFSGFGKSAGILKFPGAVEPAWPWKGMVHIRGGGSTLYVPQPTKLHLQRSSSISTTKKSKYQAVQILPQEDVLCTLARNLSVSTVLQSIRDIDADEFPEVSPCLRIPSKHYEGGSSIQRRVRKQLHTKPGLPRLAASSSDDNDVGNGPSTSGAHYALTKTYHSIATSMSAFDRGQCEPQPWIQKYSPKSALEVLQSGPEAVILKEWLQTLVVMSVETGVEKSRSRGSSLSRGSKAEIIGKRKRKSKKLDGFVVSSDEEFNDMDEITDPEDNPLALGGQTLLKKTVIRAGDAAQRGSKEPLRLSNAVVMSGPHGCGKSASVYAVAKELDFEVFEINASSRRSGKDILEKVGDMTRNHLVQQSHVPVSINEDNERIDEALAKDLQSGRQGTMNSFFKPKEPTKPKTMTKNQSLTAKRVTSKADTGISKASPKQQKQSLILIEEADIIYEEDKQFWATIISLVAQSKRPLIITCNDESVIPLQSLTLHAIIRFNPPPVDLAVDYLLLVAACEGHIIQRNAVKDLYEGRNLDLRAALTDLNFWCQFGVGDCKNGLDWFYPRWPIGRDIDQHGDKIRVVSENTYESGMGWLSQDILESHSHYLDIEEQMLHEAWDEFHVDLEDWQKTPRMSSWARECKTRSRSRTDNYEVLKMYEDFTDMMGTADICSGRTFASNNEVPLDVNIPTLSAKVREDYIVAHQILEASPVVAFTTLTKDLSIWMKSRARDYLQVNQHTAYNLEIPAELDRPNESEAIQLITKQVTTPEPRICRLDFSLAFDPISEPEKNVFQSTTTLEACSFDRTMNIIAIDLAPYVRSIVSYDARLQQDRARLGNLISEGGRKGKRMRTTRAAMSALEGGARSTTRRDRYFESTNLNAQLVLHTGLKAWTDAAFAEEQAARQAERTTKGGEESEDSNSEIRKSNKRGFKKTVDSSASEGDEIDGSA